MSFSGGTDDLSANVGSGFVGAFVDMSSHQSFVNIIHLVPHVLIFLMTLFIGTLVGVVSFSTFLYTSAVSLFLLGFLQKLFSTNVGPKGKTLTEELKKTSKIQ